MRWSTARGCARRDACWCWARPAVWALRPCRSPGGGCAGGRARSTDDEVRAACTRAGADATLDYSHADVRDTLKAADRRRGPDVVYDPVGGRSGRAGLPLDRLARAATWSSALPRAASRALPWNLALLKGAAVAACSGATSSSRPGDRARGWPAGPLVRRGPGQAGDRPCCRWPTAELSAAWYAQAMGKAARQPVRMVE